MNIFSELYVKHLARTLFFIMIGVSSAIGQNLLTKNILKDDFVATVVAVIWAALLIVIYSWFVAEREHKYIEMKDSFNYHRTLKPNNPIGAINRDYTEVDPFANRKKDKEAPVTKVEFVHSLEPMKPEGIKP
jgi:hypothetical protein